MAEIEPLDRLVRLARQEEPPPGSDAAAGILRRVRAAGRPRPAAGTRRWMVAAAVLAASAAAAAVLLALLIGRAQGPSAKPDRGPGVVKAPATGQGSAASELETVVPALDILGGLESEVNQLMGSSEPQRNPVVKT
jgi:hypothetical protein